MYVIYSKIIHWKNLLLLFNRSNSKEEGFYVFIAMFNQILAFAITNNKWRTSLIGLHVKNDHPWVVIYLVTYLKFKLTWSLLLKYEKNIYTELHIFDSLGFDKYLIMWIIGDD